MAGGAGSGGKRGQVHGDGDDGTQATQPRPPRPQVSPPPPGRQDQAQEEGKRVCRVMLGQVRQYSVHYVTKCQPLTIIIFCILTKQHLYFR